jgi:hypothetical protein
MCTNISQLCKDWNLVSAMFILQSEQLRSKYITTQGTPYCKQHAPEAFT